MVTGRNPWKSATKEDPVYQGYLQSPLTFFSTVLPVSIPLSNLLVRVLNPEWKTRMSLQDFKHAIQDIPTFYSVNVHFEGNLARYCWEVGMKARTDMVDGLFGPIAKRPVPPPSAMKQPVTRKPVSPIHEERKAKPVEVNGPTTLRKRVDPLGSPQPGTPNGRRPLNRPPPIHSTPYHASLGPAASPCHDSMVSVPLDGEQEVRVPPHISTSLDGTRGPSSQDSSFSSSFPKTPATSPHRITMVKRRARVPTDQLLSPSYSPTPEDPMEFYGLEFCKRLAALPSDADSDDTESDGSMVSPASSSRYSLHEMPGCSSCRTRSSEGTSSRSSTRSDPSPKIIRYPEISSPEPSKPIDIVGARPRHPASPRHIHNPSPRPQYLHPHPHVVASPNEFRHRRTHPHTHPHHPHHPTPPPHLPPHPVGGRVADLRKVWEGVPVPRSTQTHTGMTYAPAGPHWYH